MQRSRAVSSLAIALLIALPLGAGLASPPASAATAPSLTLASKGGNAWWVEAIVTGADAPLVAGVQARDSYGPWTALKHEPWGTWGASFAIEAGHLVVFQATLTDGRTLTSCAFQHPSGAPACGATVPPPPGTTAPFAATFAPKPGNAWWVETLVTANAPLAGVSASVDHGADVPLAPTAWGSWAKSFYVPAGALVTFAATSTSGARVVSPTAYVWPNATPAMNATPAPAPAPVPTGFAHTNIVSTTFWVGEIFNANLADGSQVCSTYDSQWAYHWSGVNHGTVPASAAGCAGSIVGGCDGVPGANDACATQRRTSANGYYPTSPLVHPKENPFYLDLPFDDVNDATAYHERCQVIPWASQPGFAGHCTDPGFSYMKNHWVMIQGPNGHVCYGQVEDAGPSHGSLYHDAAYVFGTNDARPVQGQFNDAGMDVSPALNGCLGFAELDGENDHVAWSFVDASQVPPGPWTTTVTTSQVTG
ncbi:MAG: hypothetical protein QOE90_1659 [Thermoplasmata archaeon]|nr:hypothetical protein [Thermoplasmata archaeon]